MNLLSSVKYIVRQILEKSTQAIGTTKVGRIVFEQMVNQAMERTQLVTHQGLEMRFAVPNQLNHFRITTFATKEPETLEWIDSLPENSLLWDIGANVGLYTVYAALKRKSRVVAFEPSVFNLELLARNLYLNHLQDRVTLLPIALSDQMGSNTLRMSSTEWGGALSTFGKDIGWDGQPMREIFAFPTYGLSLDQAVEVLGLEYPDYIKMDVDGIEHFLLQGGPEVLKQIKGILIEINDDFEEQAGLAKKLLESAGLELLEKKHSQLIENSTAGFANTFNQIWTRTA